MHIEISEKIKELKNHGDYFLASQILCKVLYLWIQQFLEVLVKNLSFIMLFSITLEGRYLSDGPR